ncbi:hypothetical protein BS47DRAFT_831421 [Hydnum rufescens UP504]|uniref:Uncharacterized protein n=1 Tax=Hydnum rufescens UP504 TaxID=1448309 RepID=A0A9P6ACC4_9AGAM|nr:hypothetical protein BS47DRAFT_831421 [Hydnum rufescens UP504]
MVLLLLTNAFRLIHITLGIVFVYSTLKRSYGPGFNNLTLKYVGVSLYQVVIYRCRIWICLQRFYSAAPRSLSRCSGWEHSPVPIVPEPHLDAAEEFVGFLICIVGFLTIKTTLLVLDIRNICQD